MRSIVLIRELPIQSIINTYCNSFFYCNSYILNVFTELTEMFRGVIVSTFMAFAIASEGKDFHSRILNLKLFHLRDISIGKCSVIWTSSGKKPFGSGGPDINCTWTQFETSLIKKTQGKLSKFYFQYHQLKPGSLIKEVLNYGITTPIH